MKSLPHKGFTISAQSLPILAAAPIDAMTAALGIAVPEMIFGDNFVSITHVKSGWSINFNAFDALDRVDKTGESMLKVAHSAEWQASREHHHQGISSVIKPFDWSYSTDFRGTVGGAADEPTLEAAPPSTQIPVHLLTRPDPILFWEETPIYEDELADNGITDLNVRVRVMPDRLLLLSRFFLRLDDVLFRIRDTRVYVEFATGEVIREYTAREEKYEVVRRKLAERREDVMVVMREPARLVELLPVVERVVEKVVLGT
jgi:type 2A phosphatase activator TIP41